MEWCAGPLPTFFSPPLLFRKQKEDSISFGTLQELKDLRFVSRSVRMMTTEQEQDTSTAGGGPKYVANPNAANGGPAFIEVNPQQFGSEVRTDGQPKPKKETNNQN